MKCDSTGGVHTNREKKIPCVIIAPQLTVNGKSKKQCAHSKSIDFLFSLTMQYCFNYSNNNWQAT